MRVRPPVIVLEVSLPFCLLFLIIILPSMLTFELFKVRVHLVGAMFVLIAWCSNELKHGVLRHGEGHTGTGTVELCEEAKLKIFHHYYGQFQNNEVQLSPMFPKMAE